jgi:hypothetical protein
MALTRHGLFHCRGRLYVALQNRVARAGKESVRRRRAAPPAAAVGRRRHAATLFLRLADLCFISHMYITFMIYWHGDC